MRRLKREAAIRAKEADYERLRVEETEKKKKELERMKEEYEQGEKKKQADKVATAQRGAKMRAQKKADDDKLDAKRTQRIVAREAAWFKKANTEVRAVLDENDAEQERVADALMRAREKKLNNEQEAREHKNSLLAAQDEVDTKRHEKISELAQLRMIREAVRTDQIKDEAQEELQSFIQNPFPVPLKQVLCGRVRPVPRVTELLAAYKDAREELEELMGQDFEMRAVLRNQSLFQYVYDVQKKAEQVRMRPPEPMVSDLVKKATKSSSKKQRGGSASPQSTMRSTGGFRKRASPC